MSSLLARGGTLPTACALSARARIRHNLRAAAYWAHFSIAALRRAWIVHGGNLRGPQPRKTARTVTYGFPTTVTTVRVAWKSMFTRQAISALRF